MKGKMGEERKVKIDNKSESNLHIEGKVNHRKQLIKNMIIMKM
jgi:hypothetical protein